MSGIVLVTGATGFLGRALVAELQRSGYRVQGLVRMVAPEDMPAVERWHLGDVGDAAAVQRAASALAADAQASGERAAIVHSAALISYRTQDAEEARRTNVEGTHCVIAAAYAAGIPRLVHVSSVVAVGQARNATEELDEEALYNGSPLRSHYVTTKRAAEDLALSAPPELEVVVVNPGAIFGVSPRSSNTAFFVQQVLGSGTGPVTPPGSLSVVGVDSTATGVRLALERGKDRRRYLLTESNWTHAELMAFIQTAAGRRPRRAVRAPRALWSAVTLAAGALEQMRPGERVTPQSLRLLGQHYRFSAQRARTELGWSPEPFADVLAAMLAGRALAGAER